LTLVPLGLAAGVARVEKVKIWKWAAVAGVLVLSLLIMLTQSRGAMLALGVSAVSLVLISRRRGRDFLILLGLLTGAAFVAPKGVWQRLAGLANASVEGGMSGVDPEGSAESRCKIWQIAYTTAKENPILGVGAGMMPSAHRWEALRRDPTAYTVLGSRDTHSTYLRMAAEVGVPGLLLYLAIWGSVYAKVRRVRKRLRDVRPAESQFLVFLEVAMIAFAIASVFGTYGTLSFTYLSVAAVWLTAEILDAEPWYVPPKLASAAVPAVGPLLRPRRGTRLHGS
jgi:O-antigen ligase